MSGTALPFDLSRLSAALCEHFEASSHIMRLSTNYSRTQVLFNALIQRLPAKLIYASVHPSPIEDPPDGTIMSICHPVIELANELFDADRKLTRSKVRKSLMARAKRDDLFAPIEFKWSTKPCGLVEVYCPSSYEMVRAIDLLDREMARFQVEELLATVPPSSSCFQAPRL
jgi:hypothetical protein